MLTFQRYGVNFVLPRRHGRKLRRQLSRRIFRSEAAEASRAFATGIGSNHLNLLVLGLLVARQRYRAVYA